MRSPAPAPAHGPEVLPGALSPLTADLVRGPRRPAAVLAVSRAGVYLGLGGRVLPVLATDALALPGAVRLAVPAADLRPGATAGDVVVVGAGAVRLPGLLVRGVRTWRPARVRRCGGAATDVDRRAVRRVLADAVAEAPGWLAAGVVAALTEGRPAAVAHLVGRGPGLTPSGDDALAGALLVRRALGRATGPAARASSDPLAAAVRARLATTTAVSAALLDTAADGWATPEAVALAEAVARGDAADTVAHLPSVLAAGHTSGRDLVTGMAAALETAARTPQAVA